jgi:hypothetical protein
VTGGAAVTGGASVTRSESVSSVSSHISRKEMHIMEEALAAVSIMDLYDGKDSKEDQVDKVSLKPGMASCKAHRRAT